jgi:glycosyltransferase involved in cell wall biosynthesis
VSEAASLTLMEAMAASRPVVVTDVGGNPEIVRQGVDGLLVPRRDPGALAAALLQVLDSPALARRMGESGAGRVREVYRIDRTVQRYFDLYVGMVN